MKKYLIKTLLLTFALSLLACAKQPPAEESCNFIVNSHHRRVSWARMPIQFFTSSTISQQQREAIQEAMTIWNNHFDRPVFELLDKNSIGLLLPEPRFNSEGKVISDGFNGIYLVSEQVFSNTNTKDEQARTSIHYRGDFIYEADIVIDTSETFFYESHEIQSSRQSVSFISLMVHELGHVLGMDHIDEDSVMNPTLSFGEYRVDLSDIDFESLACEYQ